MTTNDLTANEIEARPVGETSYQLSQRIYDSATNSPDQFQTVVQQLDQDSKSGAATGVNIDYDNQGKVAAITINNENLYNSSDTSVPGQLAANQLGAEIQSGDMAAALNEGLTIAGTFGISDSDIKQEVLTDLGANLGDKLKEADLTDARQYLTALQNSGGSDAPDLLTVLQAAKDQSGLGERANLETDSQTGAATAFKVDGQDLLSATTQSTDAPGPLPQANADVPPVNLFTPDRNEIPATQAPAQAPDLAPPADPPPVIDNQIPNASGDGTGAALPPTSETPSGPIQANGDTTTPVQTIAGDTSTGAAPQSGSDVTIVGRQPVADVTAVAPMTEQDKADRDLFQKAVAQVIDFRNQSLPVQRGEGYYQVVARMHENWSDDDVMEETHRLKAINNFSDELRVGQRLSLISDEEKAELVKDRLDAFDKATPDQRQQMIAEVQKQAQSCERADQAGGFRQGADASQNSGAATQDDSAACQSTGVASQDGVADGDLPVAHTQIYRSKGSL